MSIYGRLQETVKEKGAGFVVLLDPDRQDTTEAVAGAQAAEKGGADALFLGGSLLINDNFNNTVRQIKEAVSIPVILFPGDASQVSPEADAILFMSLLSGRNPEYLVGNQIKAAPLVKEYGIEPIPTAYLLIESGRTTSVQFMSSTLPIPRDKPSIITAHALAAQYLGMKLVFLEAGSGAQQPVPEEVVVAVTGGCTLPVIVGGGIRTPEQAADRVKAGASFIVVGNALEKNRGNGLLSELAAAVHSA